MKQFLLVFLGGGLGSILRYYISKIFNSYIPNFFLGTFIANTLGCLLIGIALGLSYKNNIITQNQTLLLTTGFCGGFTTFSTFAFEGQSLLKTGAFLPFITYTVLSIITGITCIAIGLWFSRL